MEALGRSLHTLQDIFAHLTWHCDNDRAKTETMRVKYGIDLKSAQMHISWFKHTDGSWGWSTEPFDDPEYNVWRGDDGFFYHKFVGMFHSPRFLKTEEWTVRWINDFIWDTGYQH